MTTHELLLAAKAAAPALAWLGSEEKNAAILRMADAIVRETDVILAANEADVQAAKGTISDVMLDRLRLTQARIAAMADGMRQVAALPDPVGEVLAEVRRPNGLVIRKTAVPLGVVAIIYESRPNVTSDAAVLAMKSGNVCVLRGGKEAFRSNLAITRTMQEAAYAAGLAEGSVSLPFVVLQAIFYGADNVVMKVAYGEISPLWCQTLRFGLAFALFMILFGKQIVKGLRGSRVSAWLPVGVVYAVAFVASSLAVDMTSATNAGFFISLPMLFTPVIALALMRRTYRLSTLVLQIAVLAGLYLLCCNGGALSFGMGEFVGLGSSALFALGIVLSERGLSEIGPAAMSAVQTGGAFLFSLGGAVATEPAPAFGTVSVGTWAAVAFLAIAGTCLAFWPFYQT